MASSSSPRPFFRWSSALYLPALTLPLVLRLFFRDRWLRQDAADGITHTRAPAVGWSRPSLMIRRLAVWLFLGLFLFAMCFIGPYLYATGFVVLTPDAIVDPMLLRTERRSYAEVRSVAAAATGTYWPPGKDAGPFVQVNFDNRTLTFNTSNGLDEPALRAIAEFVAARAGVPITQPPGLQPR